MQNAKVTDLQFSPLQSKALFTFDFFPLRRVVSIHDNHFHTRKYLYKIYCWNIGRFLIEYIKELAQAAFKFLEEKV